jgi:hypothetical protein
MYYDGSEETSSKKNSISKEDITENSIIMEGGSIKFNFPHMSNEENITFDYRAIFHACPSLQMLGIGGVGGTDNFNVTV